MSDGRSIIGNITSGALGSWEGRGVEKKAHAYCLWILTIHPNLHELRLLDRKPTITFTMEPDIQTQCSKVGSINSIYVEKILLKELRFS